ncbi:WD40 repeat domain-containing protein [Longispora sp. NPDC051575]|uniref:WD40 repeat domain-containing protein n=1 Tax=Longispora sp. NPDC051575 TaxID=3154943 RepID=UPI00343F3814
MDSFERMLTLLRRGQTRDAEQLRAENPTAWLPQWTAGDPLSPAFRQMHRLGSLVSALRVDDTFAWALAGDTVHRTLLADGSVHRQRLDGQAAYYQRATFAGDTVIAVEDERLLVWDLNSGALLLATDPADVPRPAGDLCSIAVGAGVAVAGTGNGYLLQWDLTDGRLLARTAAHDGHVARVAISVDGTPAILSLGGQDRPTVCFHDLDGLTRTGEVAMPERTVCGAWTILDGQRRAVTAAADGVLTVWDPVTAASVAQISTSTRPSGGLAFTAGGAGAVLSEARALRIVDLHDGTVRGTIRTEFRHDVDKLAVCGPFIYAAQGGHTEGRTNLLELTDPLPLDAVDRPLYLDATPATVDKRVAIVAIGEDGLYQIHDAANGQEIGSAGERTNQYQKVGGSPRLRTANVDGRDLVMSMSSFAPTLVDPAAGETRTGTQLPESGIVLAAATARDGLAATVDLGETLTVWDVATMTPRASARIVKRRARTISVALGELNGRAIVLTGADDGAIGLYDATDLTKISPPDRFPTRGSAGYTPDLMNRPGPHAVAALEVAGTVVVRAVNDTVTCIDITTGEESGPRLTHPGKVWAILPAVFDGNPVVATSCDDRVLRVWDIATGRTILAVTLPRPARRILSVDEDQIIVLDSEHIVAVGSNP